MGKTDFDNTEDVARDHSFHCIANDESSALSGYTSHVGLKVSISSTALNPSKRRCILLFYFQLPSGFLKPVEDRLSFRPVKKTQAGGRWSARRLALFSGMR